MYINIMDMIFMIFNQYDAQILKSLLYIRLKIKDSELTCTSPIIITVKLYR